MTALYGNSADFAEAEGAATRSMSEWPASRSGSDPSSKGTGPRARTRTQQPVRDS